MDGFTPAPMVSVPAPQSFSTGPQLQPAFDVIELLPEIAQDQLTKLRQRSRDVHAICIPFEDVRLASLAKIEAENVLARLTGHPQDGGFNLKPDARQVIEAQRTLDKASADFKRLMELQAIRSAAWQTASGALAAVEAWLRDGRPPNTALETHEIPEPRLNKGEGVLDGIERLRRRVRELRADLHRIQSAPFPSAFCKARMREQVEQLAQRGAPSVASLIEHGGAIEFQTQRLTSEVHAERRQLAFTAVPDIALVVWLGKEALIKRLDAEIDGEADDKSALSPEARQRAEAEVMGDILEQERIEAAAVWAAQAAGLPAEHRADCAPEAILSCRLVTALRSTALPETSHGLAIDYVGGR